MVMVARPGKRLLQQRLRRDPMSRSESDSAERFPGARSWLGNPEAEARRRRRSRRPQQGALGSGP